MSGINFLSSNRVDDASFTITTGAANAQFPIENLLNDSTTRKFRSTGNTVIFEIDLTTTQDIDTIAVVGDATSTFEITAMSVKTSVTTDFSGSPVIPITLSATHNIGYEFITEVTHRFVEVTLTGNGSFAEVSNIYVGKRTNLIQNSLSINSFKYQNADNSKIKSNDFGQKFINEFPFIKKLGGTIEFANLTEQETLDDLFLFHGTHRPLWMILDPDNDAMNVGEFKLAMYGYLEKVPEWRTSGGQLYNAPIDMRQVV